MSAPEKTEQDYLEELPVAVLLLIGDMCRAFVAIGETLVVLSQLSDDAFLDEKEMCGEQGRDLLLMANALQKSNNATWTKINEIQTRERLDRILKRAGNGNGKRQNG